MKIISLDAAAAISSWSRRTWWRRLTEGTVQRVADDVRGRAMLPWSAVVTQLAIPLTDEDLMVLAKADLGNAEAQNDIGQLFAIEGRYESALYWVRQSAQQEHPDAMQWLGRAYAAGEGVARDDNLAIMWLAKAAAHGHVIAQAQIQNLRHGG
jgi:hypothetical protein